MIGRSHVLGRAARVAVLLLAFPTIGRSAAVELVGGGFVYGFVRDETGDPLVVEVLDDEGRRVERRIPRSRVRKIHQTVAPDRLEALSPDRPEDYRSYAEELAERSKDPEARRTAERLFALAARLDPAGEGPGALAGLRRLVGTTDPWRSRRIQLLAYLIDPRHDPDLLGDVTVPRPETRRSSNDPLGDYQGALRDLRTGRLDRVEKTLEKQPVRSLFDQRGPWTAVELENRLAKITICPRCQDDVGGCTRCQNKEDVVPRSLFRQQRRDLAEIVSSELQARGAATSAAIDAGQSWDGLLEDPDQSPVVWPSWSNVVPYDLDKTVFEGGRWTEPAS